MKKLTLLSSLTVLLAACGGGDVSTPSENPSSLESSLISSLVTSTTSLTSSETTSIVPSSSTPSSSETISSIASSSSSSESIITGISRALFAYLSDLPRTESFLPEFMSEDTYLSSASTPTKDDYYSDAISKNSLPTRYFGAQLDQLWTHVGFMTSFTQNLTTMLSHAATLGDVYYDYLATNPTNPYAFSVTIGGFSFQVAGLEEELLVDVSVGNMSVTMAVLNVNNVITYWVDLFINDDNRLVIYSTSTELIVVSNLEVAGVKVSYFLSIEKNGNDVLGLSYERYGLESAALRNYVVFKSIGNTFVVAGERGDFILGASPKINVETYRQSDGAYLGSQVLETIPVTGPTYETVWYPMWSVQGWNSIQFELDNNDEKEFDQVYLNGSSSVFDVHYNTLPIVGTKTSRKYDIELKKSYVFKEDVNGDLEKVEFLYPAFFIQENELGSGPFGTANSRNNNIFSHSLTSTELAMIRDYYDALKDEQNTFKTVNMDAEITEFFNTISA